MSGLVGAFALGLHSLLGRGPAGEDEPQADPSSDESGPQGSDISVVFSEEEATEQGPSPAAAAAAAAPVDAVDEGEVNSPPQPPPAKKPRKEQNKGKAAKASGKQPAAKPAAKPAIEPAQQPAAATRSSGKAAKAAKKQAAKMAAALAAEPAANKASARLARQREPEPQPPTGSARPRSSSRRQPADTAMGSQEEEEEAALASPVAAAEEEQQEDEQRGRKRRRLRSGKKKQKQEEGEQQQQPTAEPAEQQPSERQAGKRKQRAAAEAAAEAANVAASPVPPAKRTRTAAGQPAAQQQAKQPAKQPAKQQPAKQQQVRAEAAAAPSPAAARQQAAVRSPTPAAATEQRLEVSAPPEAAAAAAPAARPSRRSKPPQPPAAAVAGAAPAVSLAEEQRAAVGPARAAAVDPAAAAADLLLRRLADPRGKDAATLELRPKLQEAYSSLVDCLNNTVELGHNNSLLLVGPRGCGKTLVAERALAALAARWNTDPADPVVGVIRLSGLAHAEERTAFKEVARQLCTSFCYQFSKAASIGENIEFLRGMLGALASADKAAVFVLDDFDLFASKRSKQTLLYNLLDALQTSGMQAAVVGLTCRQDVVEMLEKRVKSRFSHRRLELTLPTGVLPVPPRCDEDGRAGREGQDGALGVLQAMLTLPRAFPHRQYAERWNGSVAAATAAESVKQALGRCINVCPTLRHMGNIVSAAVQGGAAAGALAPAALAAAVEGQLGQAKGMVHAVEDLPVLDLILLVTAHRLAARGADDFNFEMLHHELLRYTSRGGHSDMYSKGAAAKAYDHLLAAGLLAFVDPRSVARVGSRPYAAAYLTLAREEVEEGLAAHELCPQPLREWMKHEGGLGTTAGQFL